LVDPIIILAGVLLAITSGAVIEYYRLLRRAQREYENAKAALDDVVFSFNRQLRQEAEKLDAVAYKVEANSSKAEKTLKKAEEMDKRILDVENKFTGSLENREQMLQRLDEVDKKIRDTVTSQEALSDKISTMEEQARQFSMLPEAKIEAVIPLKREKALAPLTETELSVLEMLSADGSKTAPEIKSKVKLSREHTARLMKKLYEDGYLDRDTGKIPFKYSIKKEMEKLLKKTTNESVPSA
jgi:chromosome segregation ATPase